jgi:nicotinate-nucleotide pyrophosphorylase (carboxylating)
MNFDLANFIQQALQEDVGNGDHSTLSAIDKDAKGKAVLKVKDNGILAGVAVAKAIFTYIEPTCNIEVLIQDGSQVQHGDIAFTVQAKIHTILTCERLVLNIMQRMSGIATNTNKYVQQIKQYPTTLLDTRKTTPLFRWFEKEAVRIGGGQNHRFGLYDMIMLKDNHIDFCGGIELAIDKANQYIKANNLNIKIEVETRNLDDVKRVLAHGGVHRIMLDNFSTELLQQAIALIDNKFETEASGGITLDTIASYAATGVQYISAGAIIHHAVSMDLSLKATLNN